MTRPDFLARADRRAFLRAAGGLVAAAAVPACATSANAGRMRTFSLEPGIAKVPLVGDPHPPTEVWAFNGTIPGPEIRVRQGERLAVSVKNALSEETTVHWHGIRVPNAMDGVPHLTQAPIAPNSGTFRYEFDVPDAGTFWYHPHSRSYEQVARGLAGIVVVEETSPPAVDRDVTWALADWRLMQDAQQRADFGGFHDIAHAGRIGNTVTVNGVIPESFDVRAGERIRLRLANVASARMFALEFAGHRPVVIALDGHPVEPHEPEGGVVVLAPGMRADLILDMAGAPGETFAVTDRFYAPRNVYRLLDLAYSKERPLRHSARGEPVRLPPNPLAEPDLKRAERHDMVFHGGAMGMGMMTREMAGKLGNGMAWLVNGNPVPESGAGHAHPPMLTFARGSTQAIALANNTMWHHPIHLHGIAFRIVSVNGRPSRYREFRDTVLLAPRERAEIAFVADNPGDWMFHCHVLDHQAGGMMGVFRIA